MTPETVQKKIPGFLRQPQEGDNWCWAAVASSIAGYYQALANLPVNPPRQCAIVSDGRPDGRDYCMFQFPQDGSDSGELEVALAKVGHLNMAGAGFADFVTGVVKDIDRQRPIGVGIRWGNAQLGHFVCIVGYRRDGGREMVMVIDPQIAGETMMDMDTLRTSYRTVGRWVSTYFTIN